MLAGQAALCPLYTRKLLRSAMDDIREVARDLQCNIQGYQKVVQEHQNLARSLEVDLLDELADSRYIAISPPRQPPLSLRERECVENELLERTRDIGQLGPDLEGMKAELGALLQ